MNIVVKEKNVQQKIQVKKKKKKMIKKRYMPTRTRTTMMMVIHTYQATYDKYRCMSCYMKV